MTPEQKNIECAKLDGFVKHPTLNYYYRNGDIDGNRLEDSFSGGEYAPAYSTSYDAIIPLIQKQPERIVVKMWSTFCEEFKHPTAERFISELFDGWMRLTPSQLQDALLLAHGFEI
jgi:hypothetical protein